MKRGLWLVFLFSIFLIGFVSAECVPNCTMRECGDDGCGGSCGTCAVTERCDDTRSSGNSFCLLIGECTDSDGGKTYDTKSSISRGYGAVRIRESDLIEEKYVIEETWEDVCWNSTFVGERYCTLIGGGPGMGYSTDLYPCPNGCIDGACVESSESCTDSDGQDVNTSGYIIVNGTQTLSDSCSGDRVGERYCDGDIPSVLYFTCPGGCSDGACVSPCVDLDGQDYSTSECVVVNGTQFLCDSCSGDRVGERYCDGDVPSTSYFTCPNGCYNGSCISSTISSSSSSSGSSSSGGSGSSSSSGGGPSPVSSTTSVSGNTASSVENYNSVGGVEYSSGVSSRMFRVRVQESRVVGEIVEAISEATLEELEGKIYATHSGGEGGEVKKVEIKVSPDDAVESVSQTVEGGKIMEVKIEEYEDKIVYGVKTENQARIFGLFKVRERITTKIDVGTCEVVDINRPWWRFFAF